jgi:hypothetical protein
LLLVSESGFIALPVGDGGRAGGWRGRRRRKGPLENVILPLALVENGKSDER